LNNHAIARTHVLAARQCKIASVIYGKLSFQRNGRCVRIRHGGEPTQGKYR
jgi:hypothetical protein